MLGLSRIEVTSRADQAHPSVLARISTKHFTHMFTFTKPTYQHRQEAVRLIWVPSANAGNGVHRPIAGEDPIQNREAADALRMVDEQNLRGGRTYVVCCDGHASDVKRVHEF